MSDAYQVNGRKVATATLINLVFLAAVVGLSFARGAVQGVFLELGVFLLSLIVLVRSADVFTDVAMEVGERLHISQLGTGVLIVAIGTSAPELFSCVGAALADRPDMLLGNVLGTVIANTLLGLGVCALLAGTVMHVHRHVLGTQIPAFAGGVFISAGSLYDGVISRFEGVLLLVLLGVYLRYVLMQSKNNGAGVGASTVKTPEPAPESVDGPRVPLVALLGALAVALVCLLTSGKTIIDSLINSADIVGISSVKLSTTVLAIGTSVPEIATGIALVRKKRFDGLFGEVLGSNVFDLLGIIGITALVSPLVFSGALALFLVVASVASFLVIYIILMDRKVSFLEGAVLLLLFVLFTNILVVL